uniref:Retrotransposon gag domain-containing protein n=1 Tax=Cajanus cajan TaxID=3821 RepID=A0A151UBF0_CAJCA|nr:hypothetical protein KK1_020896 [Cajanus cajan]
MNLYIDDDAIMCRVFPTSLKGPALNWYTQLPPRSISTFDELSRRFAAQYATSRPHHITSAALANLQQGETNPVDELIELQIGQNLDQCTKVSQNISLELCQQIIAEVHKNANLFAWSSADMPGISPNHIYHRLAIHKEVKPIAQCWRYNQIWMYPPDEDKTTFITDRANFCY